MRAVVVAAVRFVSQAPSARDARVLPAREARRRSRRRLLATAIVLSLVFTLVIGKLVDLQVLSPDRYTAYAEGQRLRTETLSADRGSIIDRNGTPLALSVPTRSLFVDPQVVVGSKADVAADAALLAPIIGKDPAFVQEAMTRGDGTGKPARFVYLARHLEPDVVARIEELKKLPAPPDPEQPTARDRKRFAGLAFIEESKRSQPAGNVAKSIIGQVDIDGIGLSGLEKEHANDLTGTPGKVMLERSPQGKTIAAAQPEVVPPVKGRDLQLTLDRSLQFEAERILREQVAAVEAKGGTAIVMKPETGEVLAMADVVTDPETGEVHNGGNNTALTEVYEPGSVMKIVTTAAALEEGEVEPSTTFPLTDSMNVCNARFGEAEPHGSVVWPVTEIMKHSSNVGTIKIGQELGKERLHRYLRSFGFGEPTSVRFPNQQPGALAHPDDWWCSSEGSIPIGQGVSVTPLQMLQAYNVIATGGRYVEPRLVASTIDADGTRHDVPVDPGRRVISEQTAAEMNQMLRGVVDDGTGRAASIPGYTPAGKTGTARIVQPGGGYTDEDGVMHYDATFVGFVPAEAPALSVFVRIHDPSSNNIYGGVAAAPAFSKIGAAALRELNIAPPTVDLAAGGAPVDQSRNDPTRPPAAGGAHTAAPTDTVERTEDGRVRARPAGRPDEADADAPPTTTAPPATTATTRGSGTTGSSRAKTAGRTTGATTPTTAARTTATTRP